MSNLLRRNLATKETFALAALILVAALQARLLLSRLTTDERDTVHERDPAILVGDDLSKIQASPLEDSEHQLVIDGEPSLLLVFHPACPWSDSIASAWAKWMALERHFRAVALTGDLAEHARDYVRENRWRIETYVLNASASSRSGDQPSVEDRLAGRTPWLFVTDSSGMILFEGHGARIAVADSVIRTVVPSPIVPES